MPRLAGIDFSQFVAEALDRQVDIIAPTRDGELPWFAERREDFAQRGIVVMVSPPATVAACQDKLLFFERCVAAGIPAIPTTLNPSELRAIPERLVVKERLGTGSRGIALNVAVGEAMTFAQSLQEPIFQPYQAGVELSVDVYTTMTTRFMGAVARTRDVVMHGESQVTTVVEHPAACDLAARVVEALGVVGHAVIQIIDNGKELCVVECNPRVGGASALAFAAGLKTFDWLIAEVDGDALPKRPLQSLPTGLRLIRVPRDVLQ